LLEITIALMTTAALGLSFHTTRWWGLAASTALAWLYPVAILPLFFMTAFGLYLFYRFHTRKPRRNFMTSYLDSIATRDPTCPGLG
jgi:hypothetical protein